jgi:hypothetical protein
VTDALLDVGSAVFSDCGRYRYRLTRSGLLAHEAKPGYVLWVMLNPSTADASTNDQTMSRVIRFTRREGYSHLTVVNLYAWRSRDPDALLRCESPCGPDNDQHIVDAAAGAALIICAWGADPMAPPRARHVEDLLAGQPLWCLGRAKGGEPRHPLMLPRTTVLQPYNAAAREAACTV